jgi:hypothetical protein
MAINTGKGARKEGYARINDNKSMEIGSDLILETLQDILNQLKLLNIHMSTITDEEINPEDLE